MKHILYFIFVLTICPLHIFCSQPKSSEQPSQFTFNVTVQNQNDNKNSAATTTQTTVESSLPATAQPKPKPVAPYKRCRNYFSKELKDCMSCLSDKDYYKALCKMNNRQREHYIDQLMNDALVLKKLKSNCPSTTWESLQTLDPASISKIDNTIKTYDDHGKDSAWAVLGYTLVCIIIGVGNAA